MLGKQCWWPKWWMLCGLEDHNILGNEIKYLGQWNRVLEVIKKIIYYEIHVTTEKGVLNAFYPKTLKVVLDYCCFLKVVVLCLIVLTVPYNSLSLFFTVLTLFLLDPTVSWKLLNWFYGFEKLIITVIVSCFFLPEVDRNILSIDNGTAESCYTKQRWEVYWKSLAILCLCKEPSSLAGFDQLVGSCSCRNVKQFVEWSWVETNHVDHNWMTFNMALRRDQYIAK